MSDTPGLGHNIGAPLADGVAERLALDYAELIDKASDAYRNTDALPQTVENDDDVTIIASAAKTLGDIAARGKAHRTAEKEPYMRAGDAVYAFFTKRIVDPLESKRSDLKRRIDVYQQRKLAQERAKRAAEAEAARQQLLEMQRQRDAAEAAARRARSAESAELRKAEASQAKIDADIAAVEAEEAHLKTMASSSQMVRQRFEGERSGQVGMRKVAVVHIDDVAQLDLEKLRPYLKEEVLLVALRAWAKATNYSVEMPGATIGMRDDTVIR